MKLKICALLLGLLVVAAGPGWCEKAAKRRKGPKQPKQPAASAAGPAQPRKLATQLPKRIEPKKVESPTIIHRPGTVRSVAGNAVFVDVEDGFMEFRLEEGSVIVQADSGKALTVAALQKGKAVVVTAKESGHGIETIEVR